MENFWTFAPKNVQRGTQIFQEKKWSPQEKRLEHEGHRA